MTRYRELILIFATNVKPFCDVLSCMAHTNIDFWIFLYDVWMRRRLIAGHRYMAHALHASGNNDIRKPAHHLLGRNGNGL
ncbi:hypothetical protein D1872_204050 [compost metagenome]